MTKDTLYKYFAQQLSQEQRKAVQQWVEESPEHLQEFMEERHLFDASILTIDENELKSNHNSVIRRIAIRVMQIAAIVAITLGSAHIYRTVIDPVIIPMQHITVPAGQQLNITLADGTNVWLNSKTTLSYPAIFTDNCREVSLDGEAFFRVKKNTDAPFRVSTSKGSIEVLGTTFNVEAYSKSQCFATTLLEGNVKVTANGKEYQMYPNQIAILQKDGSMLLTSDFDGEAHRWTEGIISLRNDSFENIMKKFEKFYGVNIVLENSFDSEFSYTGKFYMTDGVAYALNLLQHDIKFKYEIDKDNHIIYIR